MKKAILIQARLSSHRFPGKMIEKAGDLPLIDYVYNRCMISREADVVAVITSVEKSDDDLYLYCKDHSIPVFRGSLNNVLDRYIKAASYFDATTICRVCGDSPFVDICHLDIMLKRMLQEKFDYMAVSGSFDGFMSEAVSLESLLSSQEHTNDTEDLEHVTRYIRRNISTFNHDIIDMKLLCSNMLDIKLTVDYEKDLQLVNSIIKSGLNGFDFTSEDVVQILERISS